MAFQLYRGTDAQVQAYTGMDGELVYNMTNHSLHIQDGVTAGGFEFKTAEDMKQELLGGASAAYDTLKEIEDYLSSNDVNVTQLLGDLAAVNTRIDNLQITRVDDGANVTFTFA